MKTLSIHKNFEDFSGKPIQGVDGPITFQSVLIQCIGAFFASTDVKENILAYKVGQKIYDADDTLELEDAEFDLLDKAIQGVVEKTHFTPMVLGPLCEYMESLKD